MSLGTAVAVYFVLWWVTLFAVLPFGVRSQHETDAVIPGTDPGAPVAPGLLKKALWTTLIASVLFAAFYGAVAGGWVSFETLPALVGSAR